MVSPNRLVLVVDDEPVVAEAHVQLVRHIGYKAVAQTDPEQVEPTLVQRSDIDLVLLDIRMPKLNGMEVLQRIKLRRPHVGVVMATVVNDIEHAVNAIKSGAYNYLLKPLQEERVAQVLESYFANQPKCLIDDPRFATFITASPVFEKIFQSIKSFGEADVTVLIQGETGTGKELVARLIHSLSPRHQDRFIAVNVAALSPQLFESELFGYRKGAFTGAMQDHAGYFQEAGAGTLFLDEIGELGMDQQKKLLRVLQTRTYSRIGETAERELKPRLVIATNSNLEYEIKNHRFRDDLYYRLSSHAVVLPPLRERPDDIELLANYFLRKYTSQFGRTIQGFHPDVIPLLKRHAFPGNVRELEGIISSAVLLEKGPVISAETLPRHVQFAEKSGDDLESVQYQSIMKALAECHGNQTRAAEKLGIHRSTLHRYLREYRQNHPPAQP